MVTPTKSHRKFSNQQVVEILKETLAAMEVKNVGFFRIRAYQNAIAAIDGLTTSVYDLWQNKRLDEIPGVGESLEEHLTELFTTGNVREFEAVRRDLPQGMFALIGLRGVGAKRAFKLSRAFELHDRKSAVEKLKKIAEAGKIQVLEGFGEKSEKDILDAIENAKMTKREKQRMLLSVADQISARVMNHIKKCKEVEKVAVVGSIRRRQSTIGDIEFAVATKHPEKVIKHFLKFDEIEEVLAKGEKKLMVVLKNDVQIDFRVSTPEQYGSMLQYFTGSKQHNILLRTFALEKGLSLSEYGIKPKSARNGADDALEEFATEEAFYKKLGLPYIPPEIRHGKHEIELAQQDKLPELIEFKDIKGDLHTHTIASDGTNTLKEMRDAAAELGHEYLGITDHAPSIQSRGLKEVERIVETQRKVIDDLNKVKNRVHLLFGYEVNILVDATLALPDEILERLDLVIAGIHTSFGQSREKITKRLVAAIKHPLVDIIAHPMGRLINERDAEDVDWQEVFIACKKHDKILEINSFPNRLDLADDLVQEAAKKGIKLVINTDAHSTTHLLLMPYGVDVARRAFCEKKDILNCLPKEKFLKSLTKRKVLK